MSSIYENNLIYRLLLIIFITIFYQQVFVINVGGSFKIYEIVALLLLIIFFATTQKKIYSKESLMLFLFFILLPPIGTISNLFNPVYEGYYQRFPEAANSLRFNRWFAAPMIYLYYIFNWIVINYIIGSNLIYINRLKIVRLFVYSGSIVAFYALYGKFLINGHGFPDLIPGFLDYRNSKPSVQPRPAGFSIEPGTYVLIQSWLVLYLCFFRNLFQRKLVYYGLLSVNILALVLTMSSSLVGLAMGILIFYWIRGGVIRKIKMLASLFVLVILTLWIIDLLGLTHALEYVFIVKISNFFNSTNYQRITDSGEIRSYTTKLGIEIFKAYPIFGVGGGNSYFHMWFYDKSVQQIIRFDSAPQNAFAKVAAELGFFGLLSLIAFFSKLLIKTYKYVKISKCDPFLKAGFIGVIMTIFMLNAIYPIYSLFIWVNIALTMNIIYYSNRKFTI